MVGGANILCPETRINTGSLSRRCATYPQRYPQTILVGER
jgi:hypothetical protein